MLRTGSFPEQTWRLARLTEMAKAKQKTKAETKSAVSKPKAASVRRKGAGLKDILDMAKDAGLAWNADGAASMGAAIAYYTIFSIAPLLIISIAIAGMFFGTDAAQGHVYAQAQGFVGKDGAAALQGLVKSASQPVDGMFATLVSLAVMGFGATGVFAELQGAMDKIWQAPPDKSDSGLWYMIRRRILTFGMVLGVAFLLLVSLVVSAFISALETLWSPLFASSEIILQTVNFVVSLAVITSLFALIFKMLPRVSVAWSDVLIGAAATALLFNIGKLVIGLYIGTSGVSSAYGAAGTLVVLLLWVYYSAQIFLLGAEFTWVYAQRFGSKAAKGTH